MNRLRTTALPIIAAFLWGTTFVAQNIAADYMPPMAFNAARSIVAVPALLLVLFFISKIKKEPFIPKKEERKPLMIGGLCCGIALTIAANLQQAGLADTDAGKAGFITALYIVLVPIAGLFFKKRASLNVWIAVVIAAAGLYFLCIKKDFTIQFSDFLVFLCAIAFTAHILVIDHFTQSVDGVRLSCMQFFVTAVLSSALSLIFEKIVWSNFIPCILPILYAGIFSSGVAYTLQIVAQKDANPTVVSLLMSLESVFAVLAAIVVQRSIPTDREWIGCALMLIAVIFAQLPSKLRQLDKSTKMV